MKSKRILLISDLHCGHYVGLTPPKWNYRKIFNKEDNTHLLDIKWTKFHNIRTEMWNFFNNKIKQLQPIDLAVWNGDLIDGKGERSGGTEQIITDCLEQTNMATYCIKHVNAKNNIITYGTAYHVSNSGEDYETVVANNVGAKIGAHEWINVNGLIFDVKHHVFTYTGTGFNRSSTLSKERLWNILWNEFDEQPKSDIIIRSHMHFYTYCGEENWLGIVLPAMQAAGTKYGSRKCSGTIKMGFVVFDVNPKGEYIWQPHLIKLIHQKAQVVKI